jgi:hypothetical protein
VIEKDLCRWSNEATDAGAIDKHDQHWMRTTGCSMRVDATPASSSRRHSDPASVSCQLSAEPGFEWHHGPAVPARWPGVVASR